MLPDKAIILRIKFFSSGYTDGRERRRGASLSLISRERPRSCAYSLIVGHERGRSRQSGGRKWNFELGTFIYKVEGAREGREWSVAQEELEERLKAVEEENG